MTSSTILVADDDHAIRVVLDQALSRAGFDVRATDNGSTLWNWVEAGDGDLVITDVVMPDVDGLDLLPQIKRIRPDLKIIVMSAQSTLMTAIKAVAPPGGCRVLVACIMAMAVATATAAANHIWA